MNCAIVNYDNAMQHQFYTKGVHCVMFQKLKDGTYAAPIEMVDLIPEAFPQYTTRVVSDAEFEPIQNILEI